MGWPIRHCFLSRLFIPNDPIGGNRCVIHRKGEVFLRKMDRESKRQALEAQKRRWMQDRDQTLARGDVKSPASWNSSQTAVVQKNSRPKEATSAVTLDEDLVSQLTERITNEIRKEINIGIGSTDLREAMTEKMDKYLESELHSHMCKICSSLMLSPNNTPMLLFPCGHTFCKMCCENAKRMAKCPLCRCVPLLAFFFLKSLFSPLL
jgi:hypothetical protein